MIKSLVEAVIAQIVATVALSACIGIGAVAASFSLFHLLMLVMPSWAASGLIALTFLSLAASITVWLKISHQRRIDHHLAQLGRLTAPSLSALAVSSVARLFGRGASRRESK